MGLGFALAKLDAFYFYQALVHHMFIASLDFQSMNDHCMVHYTWHPC